MYVAGKSASQAPANKTQVYENHINGALFDASNRVKWAEAKINGYEETITNAMKELEVWRQTRGDLLVALRKQEAVSEAYGCAAVMHLVAVGLYRESRGQYVTLRMFVGMDEQPLDNFFDLLDELRDPKTYVDGSFPTGKFNSDRVKEVMRLLG